MQRMTGRFARVEPRCGVQDLALGLPSDLPRKNCWTIAEHIGDTTPHGVQHPLGRAKWDADLLRDDLRGYVLEHLADEQAVLVGNETGDPRAGRRPGRGGLYHQAAARRADDRTRPGRRPHGQPATSSTATCSRSRAPTASPPRPARSAPTTWPGRYRAAPGRSCPPDAARRATAGTTRRWSPSPQASRTPAPADPPQPHHRGAGLLPLLFAPPGPAQHPRHGRGQSLGSGGDVPRPQGTGGARRTSGATLRLLLPLHHPRPARPRLPRRHHGPRTPQAGPTRRRDQLRRTDPPHL